MRVSYRPYCHKNQQTENQEHEGILSGTETEGGAADHQEHQGYEEPLASGQI